MNILVTGGAGYVGSVLVPELIRNSHSVVVIDTFWFGDNLEDHQNLQKIKGDIRELKASDLPELDAVIHLAAVANDPSVDLDPVLSWEIGALGTLNLCNVAREKGVKTFILASSGSVYGINDSPKVTEELPLVPLSVYNKVKMIKERVVQSFSSEFRVVIFRPATICGWSPRLRLDLAVNALTFSALQKKKISVFGGDQMRPQLHIIDMVRAYTWALNNEKLKGVYNIGFENDSIIDIAKKVQSSIKSDIEVVPSNDPRSYRLDSSKLLEAGFAPEKNTHNAILDLKERYEQGTLTETDMNYNVNWMKSILKDSTGLG
jgi:nucleoside-diphosphate-sugar epimerase